jgi:hypothetical protein
MEGMHENDGEKTKPPKGPFRREAKPIHQRRFAEDCDYGDEVTFTDGPPMVQRGQSEARAPSERGMITIFIGDSAFVRFWEPQGEAILRYHGWSEPMQVIHGQRITRTGGTR